MIGRRETTGRHHFGQVSAASEAASGLLSFPGPITILAHRRSEVRGDTPTMNPSVVRQSLRFIVLLGFLAPPLAAQDRYAELERVITAELAETKTPGAILAVMQNDKIVYAKGFGVANAETGHPLTPDAIFPVASMTKMYVAAALVALAEEG